MPRLQPFRTENEQLANKHNPLPRHVSSVVDLHEGEIARLDEGYTLSNAWYLVAFKAEIQYNGDSTMYVYTWWCLDHAERFAHI